MRYYSGSHGASSRIQQAELGKRYHVANCCDGVKNRNNACGYVLFDDVLLSISCLTFWARLFKATVADSISVKSSFRFSLPMLDIKIQLFCYRLKHFSNLSPRVKTDVSLSASLSLPDNDETRHVENHRIKPTPLPFFCLNIMETQGQ